MRQRPRTPALHLLSLASGLVEKAEAVWPRPWRPERPVEVAVEASFHKAKLEPRFCHRPATPARVAPVAWQLVALRKSGATHGSWCWGLRWGAAAERPIRSQLDHEPPAIRSALGARLRWGL
jgi:hypothetical protein